MGLILLVVFGLTTWRTYRRTSHLVNELAAYAGEQALELERLGALLNEHGFEFEHTLNDLAPKLQAISTFLNQPLIGAAIPWMLRRLMRRPYRRR